MSDSGEPKTSVQESKSREGEEMTKNLKKRSLDADEDEGSKSDSSRLENENLNKKVAKETSRELETDFEPTEEEVDALPLVCSICKKQFLDPVVTKCHHYFCHKCALKHHTENNGCFVCNEPTLGVFSTAVEVKKRIDEERYKAKAMWKEVSETMEKASAMVDDAKGIAEEAVKVVAEIETIVAAMATEARETAAKAAEMVQEAESMMESAKANMATAFGLMNTVVWKV